MVKSPLAASESEVLLEIAIRHGLESAESAIGFGGRLQRREIAGLRNRGSCSIPTAPTKLTNPKMETVILLRARVYLACTLQVSSSHV